MTWKLIIGTPGWSLTNIMFGHSYPMRGGVFRKDHPVGGKYAGNSEYGTGANIVAFRGRGYWASCFPDGDGICLRELEGQSPETVAKDVRECFGVECANPSKHVRKPPEEPSSR